jgi:cytosine/adenosine deaminase-related metal-dependent hydrolase
MWRTSALTFVNGTVIGADGQFYESLRVRGRTVDRLGGPPGRHDVVIELDEAIVLPGLINAHDHLELNSFTRLKWRPRYVNVRQWIADFQPRFKTEPRLAAARRETLPDRLWVGGLKNVLSGVTTVSHHNPIHRPLRDRFPVRVVRRFGLSHSLQIDGSSVARVYRKTPQDWPWIIHAAEGIDDEARSEIETLGELGCLGPNTVLVHGVAINGGIEPLLGTGASLVWCPTSNQFLFGCTANVGRFDHAGRLAIGTDSRLSGEGDLLDEIRAAHRTRQIPPASIVRAVTTQAAEMLRLPDAGVLTPGGPADLTILARVADDPFESVVLSSRQDVRLTMRDGEPLVADSGLAEVFHARRESSTRAWVDGSERLLARWIAKRAARLSEGEPGLQVEA